MKKILFYLTLPVMAAILVGCGSNETKTMNELYTQIEKTSNIVCSTSSNEVNTVSIRYDNGIIPIQQVRNTAYLNMLNEEDLRQDVLEITAMLKSKKNENYKLSKKKTKAIQELIANVNNYTTSLEETKPNIKKTVSAVYKYSTAEYVDPYLLRSGYLELNNLMQERATYLANIRNGFVEINNLLDEEQYENTIKNNSELQKNDTKNSINTTQNSTSESPKTSKNIDSFNNSAKDYANNPQGYNREIEMNREYNFIRPPYNQMQNSQNFYYNGYRNTLFNPNRNTDTFYPRISNIDTYRFNPYYYGNYYAGEFYGVNNISQVLSDENSTLVSNEENYNNNKISQECNNGNCSIVI